MSPLRLYYTGLLLTCRVSLTRTVASIVSYAYAGGIFQLFIFIILFFTIIYACGARIAQKESDQFLERFKDKVIYPQPTFLSPASPACTLLPCSTFCLRKSITT